MSNQRRLKWFLESRFGMFIHWGVYSVPASGECLSYRSRIPHGEYRRRYAGRFRAEKYDPDQWAALAKHAGMRYMVLTARHLEGFCLWNTATTDFSATKIGPFQDLVAGYVRACRKVGLKVGLYYNLRDLSMECYGDGPGHPGWRPYVERVHEQLRELLSNYGRIDLLWLDQTSEDPGLVRDMQVDNLKRMIWRLQPHLVCTRAFGKKGFGDYLVFEQTIGNPNNMPWELCETFNRNWGYHGLDRNWKSASYIARRIATCAHLGGNYLLNVGPRSDGTIPEPCIRTLKEIGNWVTVNARAIYGCKPGPFLYADQTLSTARGNTAFIFLPKEATPSRYYVRDGCVIAGIGNRVRRVCLLANGENIPFHQQEDRIILRLPARMPDKILPVAALELDGQPRGVRRAWWHCGICPVIRA